LKFIDRMFTRALRTPGSVGYHGGVAPPGRLLRQRQVYRSRADAPATRVLFFPHGGLGDRVVFEAIVREAAEAAPRTRIVAAIPYHAGQYDAARYRPGADEVWVVFYSALPALLEVAERLRRAAESTFAWSGPVEVIGYGPPGLAEAHGVRWVEPYEHLGGLARRGVYPRFELDDAARSSGVAWRASLPGAPDAPVAVLHGRRRGTDAARNVDPGAMVALARTLRARGDLRIVVTGTDDVSPDLAAVADGAIVGDDPLLTRTAGCLAACDVLVGGESGPMHLAAAVGCPTVVVTTADRVGGRWGPFAPRERVREVEAEARSDAGLLTFDAECAAAQVQALVAARRSR
jgi:hypothetical protein